MLRYCRPIVFRDGTKLCQDFEAETGRVETGLDPINCPMKDDVAMNLLRLESRLDGAVAYLARLKAAMT